MRRIAIVFVMAAGMMNAQTWDSLVDHFFDDAVFPFNPTTAVEDGFHAYDAQMEDFSKATMQKEVSALLKYRGQFSAFPAAQLNAEQQADRDLVLSNIESTLLELNTIRMWEKNPDDYASTASSAAFAIMSRSFAPEEARLRSLVAREKLMPKLFAEGRVNLQNPPKIYTEVAIEQVPGIVSFFESDVPEAFQDVKDPALRNEFKQANANVVKELNSWLAWMKSDLLPRSKGDYAIGAENYRLKLLYDEMVDIPLDKLLEIGYADLHKNQQAFRDTAKKIDPKKTPQQILEEAEKDHPTAGGLLPAFRNTLAGLRAYIVQHRIVTVPSPVMPIVEETPPFARALTSASMDTPGPYEKVAKEAYFNVTLPDKSWSKAETEDWLRSFNRGTIVSTAIHEAFPGHYLQFLWMPSAPSKIRKLIGANTNVEGWAHYCEQMMIDEGYGNGDLKLRLGQLQDALLRDARFIVGIGIHTGRMTYQQGIDFFVNEGYQTHITGERETRRGTSDPTYLYYTLGKLEILKLREDYRKMKGNAFSLEEFHDTFLKQGMPPIKIVRKAMLGNDSPVL
ncbi:MAG TPA: DUF885 domain-containing protein [Bryobacteraceae bacterium]|nr:DUF885 domain-containing protein [Bryobacteraceae bacterium]